MNDPGTSLLVLAAAAVVAGLVLLARGFGGYRSAVRVGDTSTSRVASLAAGEVRVSGIIEAAEVTITSPLQGRECVWYRSRITVSDDDDRPVLDEERAVGFRVSDGTGSIRVFPRGARIDAPRRLDDRDSAFGEAPASVSRRPGSFNTRIPGDRAAAIAALLTARQPEPALADEVPGAGHGRRRYEEARLEVGDLVTVVGSAQPFGHVQDPDGADRLDRHGDPLVALDDPEVAMNIAAAREAGILTTPAEAWGNAAIPGFGIGKPVRAPVLEAGVGAAVLATPAEAAAIERVFDLEPDLLVIAHTPEVPLFIAAGSPGEVVAREEGRFLLGLLGAILAIGGAVGLAVILAMPG